MKRKALLCAVLALTLLFSVQPAAALTSNQRETVIEATTRMPVISLFVPGTVDITINPYQMPVQIGDEESDEQIICSPAYIVSYSDIPIKVDITVTGSVYPDSDITLVPSPTNGAGSDKRVFAYFEMLQCSTEYWDEVPWAAAYDSSKHIVVGDGTAATKRGAVTLPPLDLEGELQENAYAWFRLAGDAVRAPTNGWNENDGICATVVFTFTPQSYVSD